MEDSAEAYLRNQRKVSMLSFACMCVCCVFVFTCVLKLHIFFAWIIMNAICILINRECFSTTPIFRKKKPAHKS